MNLVILICSLNFSLFGAFLLPSLSLRVRPGFPLYLPTQRLRGGEDAAAIPNANAVLQPIIKFPYFYRLIFLFIKMKNNKQQEFPLKVQLSFHKLIRQYEEIAERENAVNAEKAKELLQKIAPYPELKEGFSDLTQIDDYYTPIQYLLSELFPVPLAGNEIKAVNMPFHNIRFNPSERYQNILKNAGEGYEVSISGMDEGQMYVLGCCFILGVCYNYPVDLSRPLYIHIPDANKRMRHYRLMYNADFIDILPTEKAVPITQEDYELLINNFENIELWKEKFPPEAHIAKGFGLEILFDVTVDSAISDLKTTLIQREKKDGVALQHIEEIFQDIYSIPDLRIGFTSYGEYEKELAVIPQTGLKSFILNNKEFSTCENSLCEWSLRKLFKEHKPFIVTDVDKYLIMSQNHSLAQNFKTQGFQSFMLIPIVSEGTILAILELASYRKLELNTLNVVKLQDILPFIIAAKKRAVEEMKNIIEAIIQKECTAIHQSVYWRFQQEAVRYFRDMSGNVNPSFDEIVFDNVYPLYGQIDIKGSSAARNNAIQKDLTKQLELVSGIIKQAYEAEPLPVYDEINFRIQQQLLNTKGQLNTDTEQAILSFLKSDIHPVLDHIVTLNPVLGEEVAAYHALIDDDTGLMYNKRKDYDESVTMINQHLADIIDKKQQEAQTLFPHYFERYKTDGVDHNIYIGASLTNLKKFNEVYVYNLRLWQLQVMCEMESEFYALQPQLPVQLNVTSLLLVYNTALSIRFRMDEKIFDVDGTYNARYEIIKKRIDKAHIKGTDKRITQKGKIAIVYSQKKDEEEYMRYIRFLESKNYLGKNIEFVDVENLQGVIGLKAMLVEVRYSKHKKKTYTYKELLEA